MCIQRDSIYLQDLSRKALKLGPFDENDLREKISKVINKTNGRYLNETEKKSEKYMKREIKFTQNSANNLKVIYGILNKDKSLRTKTDFKILSRLLCERNEFFKNLRDESDCEKFEEVLHHLYLESFEEGDRIIKFGEEIDKLYIIIEGIVGLYKSNLIKREFSLTEILLYLSKIKNIEKNEFKLKRVEDANSRSPNISIVKMFDYDINKLSSDINNSNNLNIVNNYLIEEEELLEVKSDGTELGNDDFLNKNTRSVTIIAHCKCFVVSLEKKNYENIIHNIEMKKFNSLIDEFKKSYRLLTTWNKSLIIKLTGLLSKINIGYGDILFSQNSISDDIYFSKNGTFEFVTNVSISNYDNFIEYINNTKGSLLTYMRNNGNITESNIEDLKTNGKNFYNDFSLFPKIKNVLANNNIKNLKLNIKNKKLIDLKNKEEEIENENILYPVKVRTINFKEIFGLEEAIELKKRFYTVRCISKSAEVYKIRLHDFIFIINMSNTRQIEVNTYIIERKEFLLLQIKNAILTKIREKNRRIDQEYKKFLMDIYENETDSNKNTPHKTGLKIVNTKKFKSELSTANINKSCKNDPNMSNKFIFNGIFKSSNILLQKDQLINSKSIISNHENKQNERIITRIPTNENIIPTSPSIIINKSEKKTLNQCLNEQSYRSILFSKNYDISDEISKVIGKNYIKPKTLYDQIFDTKLINIHSLLKDTSYDSHYKQNTASFNNSETDKFNQKQNQSLRLNCKTNSKFFKSNCNRNYISPENLSNNKRGSISIEIKMKYFKTLNKRNSS